MAYIPQVPNKNGMITEVIDYSYMQSKSPQTLHEGQVDKLSAYSKDDPYLQALVEQKKRGISKV